MGSVDEIVGEVALTVSGLVWVPHPRNDLLPGRGSLKDCYMQRNPVARTYQAYYPRALTKLCAVQAYMLWGTSHGLGFRPFVFVTNQEILPC